MAEIPKSQETKTPATSVESKRNSMDSTESNESKESTLTFSKIQSYYKKNFIFTKKKFKTGPDRVVTPQTQWKVTSACLSIWYPERSRKGYSDINEVNAESLFANIDRYGLQKWMFHTTIIEKQQYLEDIYNKHYKHNVESH